MMQVIDLIDKSKSGVGYEISRFPDGEVKVTLGEFSRKEPVDVRCRIRNANELFVVMQVADILNRHGVQWVLHIYYLMSMRMDRVMTFNDPFTLKIVTNVINGLGADYVSVYHPHSDKTGMFLNNWLMFGEFPIHGYDLDFHKNCEEFCSRNWQICFPDEGAAKRYMRLYEPEYEPLVCEKVRDVATGQILGIKIKNPDAYANKPIMVVDDLCDAGGTFLGVANAIREIDPEAYLAISVIHMVNKKGIDNLCSTYDEVFFTNSYCDWKDLPMKCKMFDVVNEHY